MANSASPDRRVLLPLAAFLVRPEWAARVVSPSYDGLPPERRSRILEENPYLYANAILSADVTGEKYSPEELAGKNRQTLAKLLAAEVFEKPSGECLFVYRLEGYDHCQTALVGLLPLEVFRRGQLRAHETTQGRRQELLRLHLERVGVQSSPIGMFQRNSPDVLEVIELVTQNPPALSFVDIHEVRQSIWRIEDTAAVARLNDALAGENLYLTDGHHRLGAAIAHNDSQRSLLANDAAVRIACSEPSDAPNIPRGGAIPSDFILSAVISQEQTRVMGFHRVLHLPEGISPQEFAKRLRNLGDLRSLEGQRAPGLAQPTAPGQFGVFLAGTWHSLVPWSTPQGLDAAWLQEMVFEGLLGMSAEEITACVEYLPGRPPMPWQVQEGQEGGEGEQEELRRRCESSGGVGFALHPVPLKALCDLCDAGALLPPKSTFFHPKPRSGVFLRFLGKLPSCSENSPLSGEEIC